MLVPFLSCTEGVAIAIGIVVGVSAGDDDGQRFGCVGAGEGCRVGDVMGEQLAEESEENVDGRGLRPTGGGASGVGAAEGGATSAKRATNMNMQIW